MKTLIKKLDRIDNDLTANGFILDTGEYVSLSAGITHADTAESCGDTLENMLACGVVRINIKGEQLAVEHNFDLTRAQQKCIIRIIRANKFYSLIYFQLDKKDTIELNEWTGIKQYHLEKIWSE